MIVYDQRTDREVGIVRDIGPGGLSFEYFGVGLSILEKGEFGLLVWDSDFYIGKIAYRVVADFEIAVDDHSPVPIRHCSVRFEDLDPEKTEEVLAFIRFFS